ncbi:Na+/H+ antiporter family protein [Tissierella sp. MSJ-40]|uniref:Na+/H+ antiporter family protein n=1 Tax=Tissierella simiarum TaxID=2841534 RepID=A0ABS6E4I1_9FIRM|nr:Na+/H+ antiporter family protein [Tissierella simiarum]MBU5437818.1 Na+/H+ antiporter family protein [Tissierella simiarum]
MLLNPVVLSVIVMTVLCLLKLNVILALILAALTGGLLANMSLTETMKTLIGGMGGNSETALSYILLGALAIAISKTGVADILAKKMGNLIKDKRVMFVLLLAFIACFSQNLIPVHIAFIPILIPPLLSIMNKLKIDRRAAACALTFGLKAPYVMIPVGFGLMFHNIIRDALIDNGVNATTNMIWKSMLLPGIGMIIGLFIAVFFSYRKPREYKNVNEPIVSNSFQHEGLTKEHIAALIGAIAAFVVQIITKSLPLGALTGLIIMLIFGAFKWKDIDDLMNGGIGLMGFIGFVMLVASGYGAVIRATGGVEQLVEAVGAMLGGSKIIAAFVMLLIGLIITMGIGTSFGTIPIIATIYVPLAVSLGFSPAAIIALVGTAGALGDAGSPASDSTLGPTAGLNIDSQHDHIWDTCVPTFLHYNIPLIIFGTIAALIL